MGGAGFELRGTSKEDVYSQYVEWHEEYDWEADLGAPYVDDEEGCMDAMEQDPETGEWVLLFHAHT